MINSSLSGCQPLASLFQSVLSVLVYFRFLLLIRLLPNNPLQPVAERDSRFEQRRLVRWNFYPRPVHDKERAKRGQKDHNEGSIINLEDIFLYYQSVGLELPQKHAQAQEIFFGVNTGTAGLM